MALLCYHEITGITTIAICCLNLRLSYELSTIGPSLTQIRTIRYLFGIWPRVSRGGFSKPNAIRTPSLAYQENVLIRTHILCDELAGLARLHCSIQADCDKWTAVFD